MRRFRVKLGAFLTAADTVVLVEDGRALTTRGEVRPTLLNELAELARANELDVACVRAETSASEFRLSFVGVPRELHQRFRNVWAANWP